MNNDLTIKNLYESNSTLTYNNGTYSFKSTATSQLCLVTYICGNNLSGVRNYALLKIDGNITQHISTTSSSSGYNITSYERDIIITSSGFTLKTCYVCRSGAYSEYNQGISILFIDSFMKYRS